MLVIVDDNAGFHDEARALLEQHGISVVGGMSTYDEREYADLTEASPAVGFLAKTDLSAVTIQRRGTIHRTNAVALSQSPFRIAPQSRQTRPTVESPRHQTR